MELSNYNLWWFPIEQKEMIISICEDMKLRYKIKKSRVNTILVIRIHNKDIGLLMPRLLKKI
jgi:hypothetical protein